MAQEWVLRGTWAAHGLTIDRAWAEVLEEWAAAGIRFDRSRGYDPQVVDVAVDGLLELVEQQMGTHSADPDRLTAPATVYRAEMGNGFVEYSFACWDLLPEGW